ncbi:Extracellular matrix protein fras1 [Curvularia kusanoi]|uniref:Extracellular matrix protein fras1 n=1 Tax=Curvularia kusanoi TaxID=90978 RepID=A0A9P4TM77_CURKU|nr:Extracellular matrix protein fras1 [Curvularia kusanoi]
MKTSTFAAISLLSLSSTVLAAPTPQITGILGSIVGAGAGNDNLFEGNGANSGNNNGQGNSAGNNNGNNNNAGVGNTAGSGNTVTFPSIGLKERAADGGLTGILGSITNPKAGSGNSFLGNGAGSGNNNGQGNTAGNNNGNDNSAGNGNIAGSGNTVTFPSIGLKERAADGGLTALLGSITNPSAGDGNKFLGNGAGSGNNNGQGNTAGNNNGNGNTVGSGNEAGSGNTINFRA